MIPIISFILLKGHCRTCDHKLSSSLFFAEIGSSLFYAGVFADPIFLSYKLPYLLVFHLLLISAIADLHFMIIPNRLLLLLFLLSLFFIWFLPLSISSRLLGLLLGLGLPLLVLTLTRGGLGGGDVKLFMLLGWLLGWSLLLRLMILSCTCGILGFLFLRLFKKKSEFPRRLPFAPFILIGFLLAFIWGFWRSTKFLIFRG
jgi:prepilin signal peptidase PulO-like enzyme (type II secretory pathway)